MSGKPDGLGWIATVYLVGLGMYELYLNGGKVGNQVLAPLPTDYHQSVTYNTFDVTPQIKNGENAIGVVLGNGRYYNMRQHFKPYKIKSFGYPKLLFRLEIEYADGTRQSIISDESWKINANRPIRSNNEYDGEIYDATREFNGWNTTMFSYSTWQNAKYAEVPEGLPVAANTPNMVVASVN
jgi:alpha-L-rhamnosidase